MRDKEVIRNMDDFGEEYWEARERENAEAAEGLQDEERGRRVFAGRK